MIKNKIIKDFILTTLILLLCVTAESFYILFLIKIWDLLSIYMKLLGIVTTVFSFYFIVLNFFNYIKLIFLLKKLLNIINKY